MNISENCFDLLEELECSGNINNYLTAYKCPAGRWTIGMGNTYYADGSNVKEGDTVTHNQAAALFYGVMPSYEAAVNKLVTKPLTQNQFDALISFVYNVGVEAFSKSTLLSMININPNDTYKISNAWNRWIYFTNPVTGKKQISEGLQNRRKAELALYFK